MKISETTAWENPSTSILNSNGRILSNPRIKEIEVASSDQRGKQTGNLVPKIEIPMFYGKIIEHRLKDTTCIFICSTFLKMVK